mgnify:CR=1 FL=1
MWRKRWVICARSEWRILRCCCCSLCLIHPLFFTRVGTLRGQQHVEPPLTRRHKHAVPNAPGHARQQTIFQSRQVSLADLPKVRTRTPWSVSTALSAHQNSPPVSFLDSPPRILLPLFSLPCVCVCACATLAYNHHGPVREAKIPRLHGTAQGHPRRQTRPEKGLQHAARVPRQRPHADAAALRQCGTGAGSTWRATQRGPPTTTCARGCRLCRHRPSVLRPIIRSPRPHHLQPAPPRHAQLLC